MPKPTFGPFVRQKRVEAGKSLRQLARELNVSAVYLGEVERGRKPHLKRERWPDLVAALPVVSMDALEKHALASKPVQLDLDDAPVGYLDVTHALARRIQKRDLSEASISQLLEVLRGEEE